MNVLNVRHPIPYLVLGVLLWLAFLKSGVHATVSGVLLAMTIPARPGIDPQTLIRRGRELLGSLEKTTNSERTTLTGTQQAIVQELEDACDRVESPLQSLEHEFHPYVTYFIMPVFALANAGVTISSDSIALAHPVGVGIIVGLVLGKLIGISLFSWVSVRFRLARLPEGTRFAHIVGTAALAGIGFTMSLFIAQLAFRDEPFFLDTAKASILAASTVAGIVGFVSLYLIGRVNSPERPAED
jgi:NhaA family Na+:H+ antiporter